MEGHVFVCFIEGHGLPLSLLAEAGIDIPALHNTAVIVSGLPVADQVYFFTPHFLITLAANKSEIGRNCKLKMFDPGITLEDLNALNKDTMASHLGIEFIELGSDYVKAKMPVDERTHQPFGMLHGGASVALAETLGSVAAYISVDMDQYYCVGLEINANHIRAMRSGYVYGTAKPLHQGKATQVWEIRIENDAGQLVCISRITNMVLKRQPSGKQNH